jgi:D-xylose transport system substrate-binding protein
MSQQDHKDFFISYNGADQRWAEWIAWQLEEAAYTVILQAWDFLPGSNFVVQMDRALTLAPRMIAVLSPQYLSALYTQPEWAAAFHRDPKGELSLLIPVRVQPCEVTGLLGPIVYVDLVGRDEAMARQRLLAAVRHERAKPAQAPDFPQTIEHTITKHLNFPGDLPPIWNMPHERDPLFLGREQLLQELHNTLATEHRVLLFEPASEREAGTSGAAETAVEYAYRYRSDYQVIAWIRADSREALQSDLLSLAAELHLPPANPSVQDPLAAVIQWLRTHQHWLLVLDQAHEKEALAPLIPLPEQGHLLVVTSTRSLESLAPLLELNQVPWEEQTMLTQLSQVVGAALQGPQGRMPLGLEPITVGRASTNQVVLSDPSVSSRHAIIELKDQAYWITDRGSTNGTLLNQQRLVPHVPSQLHPGATIRLGNITCTYEVIDRPSRSPVSTPTSEQKNISTGAYAPSSPTIERPHQDRVGQRFGNYRLSRLLGLGGFAEVYLGEHIYLGTQTAIKVMYTQLVGQDVEQFRQEARTIAHMEHPHIVRLLDFGVEGTTPYLIMSYAPNGTMRQHYPKGTRLPVEQVVSYVKQISEALQYAHDHRVIHRDIKPENILFGPDDQVVLSDFGIALVTQSSRFQQPNDMAGTIAYMAPEQIEAHPRLASDQYSLGIVVYEWLCGERPFHGSFTEIAVKHQLVVPPSLREKVPSLPSEVEQVVMTALAKDPKARFGSVQAFATALEQASQPAPSHQVVLPSEDPHSNQPLSSMNVAAASSQLSPPMDVVIPPPGQTSPPIEAASPLKPMVEPTVETTLPLIPAGSPPPAVRPSGKAPTRQEQHPPPQLNQEAGLTPLPQVRRNTRIGFTLAVCFLLAVLIGGGILLYTNGVFPFSKNSSGTNNTNNNSNSSGSTGAIVNGRGCKKIGVLLPETATSARWENKDRPLLQQLIPQQLSGATVDYNNAQGSADTQQTQAQADLTNGACILVLAPVDSVKAASIVAAAKAKNVPVISYDRLIWSNDLNYYVSFDPTKVGQLQGQYIADHYQSYVTANGTNMTVMINGAQTDYNALLFSKGAHEALDPLFAAGSLKKVYETFTPGWDNATAQTEMQAALTANGNKVAVAYVANDGMANSVIAALKSVNLNGKVLVTGQDATVAGIHNILTGDQAMTVYKKIDLEANATAQLVAAISNGTDTSSLTSGQTTTLPISGGAAIPSVLETPISVDKSNIASTVIADGFVTAADVCQGLPSGTGGICP